MRSQFTVFFQFVLLSFLVVGCSLWQAEKSTFTDKKNIKSFQQELSKVCFTGDGKGKVQLESRSYTFSHEAVMDWTQKKWSLAFSIPFKGEEIFVLNWEEESERQVSGQGTFYNRIQKELARRPQDRLLFNLFVEQLAHFLKLVHQVKLQDSPAPFCRLGGDNKVVCELQGKRQKERYYFQLEPYAIQVHMSFHPFYSLALRLEKLKGDRYQSFSAALVYEQESKDLKRRPVKIQLFYRGCE